MIKITLTLFIAFSFIMSFFIPTGLSFQGFSKDASDIQWWYDLDAPSFGSAATADIDDDGFLEIVFGTYFNDEHIYALNANNGTLLWKYNTGGCNDASPVIYDVDMDGKLEVIIPSSSPYEVYCFNGATGEVEWSTSTGYPNCIDSPPAVADVDNDGKPEVILGSWYGYVFCLNGEDGSICWQVNIGSDSYIQAGPNIVDVDDDGQLDVVVAQYDGDCRIYSLYGNNGSTMWYSTLPTDYMYHGASFADIDEDEKPELVIGCYDGNVYVFNAEDGSLAWEYAAPNYIASPTSLADLNNDDHLEIVFTSYNYLGVLSNTGDLLWDYTTGGSMFRGASIVDTDNDGILDVIFGSDDGILRVVRGNTGSLLWSLDIEAHYGDTFNIDHAPVIEDFDEDGKLDIFIIGGYGTSNPEENNHGRAYVIDAGDGTGPGWPMFRHDIHHSACFHYQQKEPIVYVDDNAESDWYDESHVRTIQEGINNASTGDLIYVFNGTYYENIDINKTIELTGEQRNSTLIQGIFNDSIINISIDGVILNNFTIRSDWENEPFGGICIESNHNVIMDNIIEIQDNCIDIYSSTNNIIFRNQIANTNIGISITSSSNNSILKNMIKNTNTAIELHLSSNNIINYNNLSLNNYQSLFLHTSCNDNTIKGNTILNNGGDGIEIYASQNNIVNNNEIILNGETGIRISTSTCNNNTIYHNNFINNTINAYDKGQNFWDNGYPSGGNYWSDYFGFDGNGDNIGDTPYNISGGDNQDLYPIMNENGWGILGINQSIFDRGFPIRHAIDGDWAAAQSFIPTLNTLTSTEIYMRKFGTPEFNLTVELREDHPQGTLIDTVIFTPAEVPSSWEWFEVDFTDTTVTPDSDYFIVIPPAPSGVTTSFGYEWGYALGNPYPDGAFWFTRDGGGLWRDLPDSYEFAFRTYGYSAP